MQINALDWTIIVSYFALTLSIGFAFRKRAGRSIADYFVSGRSFPWWVADTSMVATTFAADTPLLLPEWSPSKGSLATGFGGRLQWVGCSPFLFTRGCGGGRAC